MTRGRCGSLRLHRNGLAPSTFRRSPGAPVHSIRRRHCARRGSNKTPEQQSCLTLHRTRHLFIRQQTSVINAIRAHLAEFGIVAPVGRHGVEQLLGIVADAGDRRP